LYLVSVPRTMCYPYLNLVALACCFRVPGLLVSGVGVDPTENRCLKKQKFEPGFNLSLSGLRSVLS
jgi:hypothetical protein